MVTTTIYSELARVIKYIYIDKRTLLPCFVATI